MARRRVNPNEWARLLRLVGRELQVELARAGLKGGFVMVRAAKRKITEKGHVDTGALRRDINAQIKKSMPTSVDVAVGCSLHYAKYVEALPDGGFLFEAVEESAAEAVRVTGAELEKAISRAAAA